MFEKMIVWFIELSPTTKRWFWKRWYNLFAATKKTHNIKLMNYGYDSAHVSPPLDNHDEKERYSIQLYHYLCDKVKIKGQKMLEIGSGRGGGASYIARHLNPLSLHGVDISKTAIKLCKKTNTIENLEFTVGDSENLPFTDNSFDIILNVESSHCYGNMPKFLTEVRRVLKPGGHFLWCDLRESDKIDGTEMYFKNSGLIQISREDITENILSALRKMTASRKEDIKNSFPKFAHKTVESFAGVEGSDCYNAFANGSLVYLSATYQKPQKSCAAT